MLGLWGLWCGLCIYIGCLVCFLILLAACLCLSSWPSAWHRDVSCSLLKLAPFLLLSGEYLTPADGLWEFSCVSCSAHKDGKWAIFPLLPFSHLKLLFRYQIWIQQHQRISCTFFFLYIVNLWMELLKLLFKTIWPWLHRGYHIGLLLVLQHTQAAVQFNCEAEVTTSAPAPHGMLWCVPRRKQDLPSISLQIL